jgi:hypothetical protein
MTCLLLAGLGALVVADTVSATEADGWPVAEPTAQELDDGELAPLPRKSVHHVVKKRTPRLPSLRAPAPPGQRSPSPVRADRFPSRAASAWLSQTIPIRC